MIFQKHPDEYSGIGYYLFCVLLNADGTPYIYDIRQGMMNDGTERGHGFFPLVGICPGLPVARIVNIQIKEHGENTK